MAAFPFDTHEAFKRLRGAGATETQAEAFVTTMCEAFPAERATAPFHPEQATKRLRCAGYSPALASAFVRVFRQARGENVPEQQDASPHLASN